MLLVLLLALSQSGDTRRGAWQVGSQGVGELEPVPTSGRPIPAEQASFDVWQYWLKVRVDPETRRIDGEVEICAKVLETSQEIVLDLDDRLTVSSVVMRDPGLCDIGDDQPAPFTRRAGEIRIRAPEQHPEYLHKGERPSKYVIVTVRYGGRPREAPRPPWDGGFVWSRTPSGAHWIATANEMQGADLWWPCKDQPDDEAERVMIWVTVPKSLVVASNGRLGDVIEDYDGVAGERREGWHEFQWFVSTPINTYGIALNIAPYQTITRDYTSVAGDTFPVTYWVLPENLDRGKVLFEDILRQLAFCERVFGPYPFRRDKYGVAETPYLGMEHQTIIAYGNRYALDRLGYDELHLHELAHEWWANLVTCAGWNDLWIHEGFASYAQALYAEHVGGETAYRIEMFEQMQFANRAALAPRARKSTVEMYYGDREGSPGSDVYSKGAWVLHSLRWLLGDEKFFAALRRMAYPDPELESNSSGRACRFATTDQLQAIVEKASGAELGWFFEAYLRQPKLPGLEWRVEEGALLLEWNGHAGKPFPMPVEVLLGNEYVRVACPDGKGRLELDGEKYVVDPWDRVLREGNGKH